MTGIHRFVFITTTAALVALTAFSAHAGIVGNAGKWLTGEVGAYILSAVIALIGAGFGTMFVRMTRTFKETGEFLAALGEALEDRRITREELAAIIREGRDIFRVWR